MKAPDGAELSTLQNTPVTPAAVLDLVKLEVNCQRMLDVAKKLGMGLRAHVKTHKVMDLIPHETASDTKRAM
jgi:D-serine deaminase-like pyridoxal phosphate-dependent protein